MVGERHMLAFGGGFEQGEPSPPLRPGSVLRRHRHGRDGVVLGVPDFEAFVAVLSIDDGDHAAAIRQEPGQPVPAAWHGLRD